jgi:hemerythrin-like metal-binding protein
MTASSKCTYKTCDAGIGSKHQGFFNNANAVLASINDSVLSACIASILDTACQHIKHEETLMRDIKYPASRRHVQQHLDLLASLDEILENLGKANFSKEQLDRFFNEVLLTHMKLCDPQLAAFICTKKCSERKWKFKLSPAF